MILTRLVVVSVLWASAAAAQWLQAPDVAPLKHWPAPLYYQPPLASNTAATPKIRAQREAADLPLGASALVFVAMNPCRIVDTRSGSGFTGAFGPPALSAGATRTIPIQSSACGIPSVAQAYSFNVTVVPPAPLGFLTLYPAGQSRPNASTLNSLQGAVVANAAIVAAGSAGAVSVYASNNTEFVLDINGYYSAPSDANSNTALGAGALALNTVGEKNTAIGVQALFLSDAPENTAVGYRALYASTGGNLNTAVGAEALEANMTSSGNTAVGARSLAGNTAGLGNTALGEQALGGDLTGGYNIGIGHWAGTDIRGNYNIDIGNIGVAGDEGVIRIGTGGEQTETHIAGIRGRTTGAGNGVTVLVDSNGQLGTTNSSRRFKEDIQDMGDASSGLLRLRPVTFRYKQPYLDGSTPVDYGLIAEEVADVFPDLVVRDARGDMETVQYHKLTPMLVNELQRQNRMLTDVIRLQREASSELRRRIAALEMLLRERVH
jgi:hypothetical protein